MESSDSGRVCTVTVVERPGRKLIFLPSISATDYGSFCREKGCGWEGLLNSIPCKMDSAAILTLPARMTPPGFSNCAAGVEVASDYGGIIPDGYRTADLDACRMLYFHGEPFENEDDFGAAIAEVFRAYRRYDPSAYGLRYADTLAPSFNFGAKPASGAKIAFPVRPDKPSKAK